MQLYNHYPRPHHNTGKEAYLGMDGGLSNKGRWAIGLLGSKKIVIASVHSKTIYDFAKLFYNKKFGFLHYSISSKQLLKIRMKSAREEDPMEAVKLLHESYRFL